MRFERSLVLVVVLLAGSLASARADDFATLAATPRLQRCHDALADGPAYKWPCQIAAALAVRELAATYPAPRYHGAGPLAVCRVGERTPVAEAAAAVLDAGDGDVPVMLADVRTLGSAETGRNALRRLRAVLLDHRTTTLEVRDPARDMRVVGRLRPTDALPRLLAFGPANGRGFDVRLPVRHGDLAVLYRTLLHRAHPADALAVAASPATERRLALLVEQTEPIDVVGQVLEVLVRHHLADTAFPAPTYRCTGGLEYCFAGSSQVLGELDVLVVRTEDHKVVLIGEAKLSQGESFKKALDKAKNQMERIRSTLEGPTANDLVFTYGPDPTEVFTIDDFRSGDLTYRIFGSRGAVAYGFDDEVDVGRDEGDILFREVLFRRRDGRPVLDILSNGACRDLFDLRRAAVVERRAHDGSYGVTYGDRTAAMRRAYPRWSATLQAAGSAVEALTALAAAGAPWHETAEVLRNHAAGPPLLRVLPSWRLGALLVELDCPAEAAAAILAVTDGALD